MDRIIELDARNFTLRAQAGVLTQAIYDAADAAGLFYPPDPGSMKVSTIGGNVAENSGGLRGPQVRRHARLCHGPRGRAGRRRDLPPRQQVREGRRGLQPEGPLHRQRGHARHRDGGAAAAAAQARRAPDAPCDLRPDGGRSRDGLGHHRGRDHPLHPRVPGLAGPSAASRTTPMSGCPSTPRRSSSSRSTGIPPRSPTTRRGSGSSATRNGAASVRLAADAAEAARLAAARRSAFSALARVKPTTILEDATVPRSELAQDDPVHPGDRRRGTASRSPTFGHFGDGNLHPTFLTDERDADEMRRVELAMKEIFAHALSARRDDHGRARRRPGEEGLPQGAGRRRELRPA